MKQTNRDGMYGIHFVGRQQSWKVSLFRVDNKVTCNRSFSISRYGSSQKALDAAREFRNRKLKERHGANYRVIRANNTSGIVGVRYNVSSVFHQCTWMADLKVIADNKDKTASFAVSKYGYATAKRLAMRSRELNKRATLVDIESDAMISSLIDELNHGESTIFAVDLLKDALLYLGKRTYMLNEVKELIAVYERVTKDENKV